MSSSKTSTRRHRWRITLVASGVVLLTATAGTWSFLAPPSSPPDYTDERPEAGSDGYVSVTRSTLIDAPVAAVHSWNNEPSRELDDLIEGGDDFPEVIGTTIIWGDWNPASDRTGDRRRVEFADGHYLAEEVLEDTPARFRYMIWGFTSHQRLAVRHGVAEFAFAAEGEQTRVTWTYSMKPTTPLLRPFVTNFLERTMSTMMEQTLAGMRAGVEAESGTQ
ncbi:SRPBCC family protein [Natronosporangium hydrolyticum]|uniref:SRPBCC family protein n=1 Tax=Natronosporangium hydrolyticum TaxID=2811111 RepID=A0A895YJZ3_9ACTN|nr:SRPBCC family protein [Natronosporangium hydrolyticum]QSB15829.1 SRPBCC family protein [Natronosporangium hydrolyticum]